MTTIGIIGTGNVGSQLARAAVRAGYSVVLANSRGPESIADLATELGEHARAATIDDAASAGRIVVVSIPLQGYPDLPVDALDGRIVVDTGNYYPAWNGQIDALDAATTTSSEMLQALLPGSRVVKAFNNLGAADMTTDGAPAGQPGRRALVVAGDDADARRQVAVVVDAFGFDVVDAGPLAEGWRYQPDQPAYGVRHDAAGMRAAVAAARR
ncbi:NADPH-dependent F420 reductase [Jatrophihabitans sp. YIM 134969]